MKAHEITDKATKLVGGDRARTHGDKAKNHDNIARLWQAYLEIRPDPTAPLAAHDAAHMMALLKLARTQAGEYNVDDYVDLAGYAGVGGEIAGEECLARSLSPDTITTSEVESIGIINKDGPYDSFYRE